jgi:outer membrane protein assembly factor BamE (lipoprotein component of BamABCDE complex)
VLALALAGCAGTRELAPGQSSLADVEAAMGTPVERRQVGAESWLYYPSQPYGRKVFVARLGSDGRLIAVEQHLSEDYVAKLLPNQSRREDVLALLGQPYERLNFPRLDRESWSWHMRRYSNRPAGLHVQMSPDGVVREIYILDEDDKGDRRPR